MHQEDAMYNDDSEVAVLDPAFALHTFWTLSSSNDIKAASVPRDSSQGPADAKLKDETSDSIDDEAAVLFAASDSPLVPPNAAAEVRESSRSPKSSLELLFDKRIVVLRAILEEINDEVKRSMASRAFVKRMAERKQPTSLATSRSAHTSAQSSAALSPALRWVLLSIFPLIESVGRGDPSLNRQLLGLLLEVLKTSPPLSLAAEQKATCDAISRFVATAQASAAPEDSATVLDAMVGLAVHRGSLSQILRSLHQLLAADPATPLDLAAYIAAVRDHCRAASLLSVATSEHLVSDYVCCPAELRVQVRAGKLQPQAQQSSPSSSSGPPPGPPLPDLDYSSLATDGTFLYIHRSSG